MFEFQASVDQRTVHCAAPAGFRCGWSLVGRCAWVHPSGTLADSHLSLFAEDLAAAQLKASMVIVDLRDLAFLGGGGVEAIDAANQTLTANGHSLILVRGSGQVDRQAIGSGLLARVEAIDLQRGGSSLSGPARRLFASANNNQEENHVRAIQHAA